MWMQVVFEHILSNCLYTLYFISTKVNVMLLIMATEENASYTLHYAIFSSELSLTKLSHGDCLHDA